MIELNKKSQMLLKLANILITEILNYNDTKFSNVTEPRKDSTTWKPPIKETPPIEGHNGTSLD